TLPVTSGSRQTPRSALCLIWLNSSAMTSFLSDQTTLMLKGSCGQLRKPVRRSHGCRKRQSTKSWVTTLYGSLAYSEKGALPCRLFPFVTSVCIMKSVGLVLACSSLAAQAATCGAHPTPSTHRCPSILQFWHTINAASVGPTGLILPTLWRITPPTLRLCSKR